MTIVRTIMGTDGRVEIPRAVRRQAGLQPGTLLEVRWRDGHIAIEPASLSVRLERRGRFVVAVPRQPVPPLATTTVERTRAKTRRERLTGI